MNGCMAIDFRPGSEAVPHILRIIDDEGYDLCGLHLIPSCEERWTLMVDLGCAGWAPLSRLQHQLQRVDDVIEVIHKTPVAKAAADAAA